VFKAGRAVYSNSADNVQEMRPVAGDDGHRNRRGPRLILKLEVQADFGT
jgi:hypothetical protein